MNSQNLVEQNFITQPQLLSNEGTCLHIGCGLNAPQEWRNIDASPSLQLSKIPIVGPYLLSLNCGPAWPKTVSYGDIVKGLDCKDNSCDLIFAAHVLEHLSLSDLQVALKNICTYLKPQGIFRFIVPDLKQYVDTYLQHYSDSALSGQASYEFMESSWLGQAGSRRSFYHRLREALANSRHQWMWDEPSLLHIIPQYGFKSVRRCQYGDWADARFSIVEREENYSYALGIEAIK